MRVSDFDFPLPPELIAQHPPAQRGDSRMMTVSRATGEFTDRHFSDFPSLLNPGDLLVLNNSRVIPARLFGRRAGLRTQSNSPAPTGQVEVLLTQPLGNGRWKALVKPGRKVPVGERLIFEAPPPPSSSRPQSLRNLSSRPQRSGAEVPALNLSKGPAGPVATESCAPFIREADGRASREGATLEATVIDTGDFGERTLQFDPIPDFFAVLDKLGHMPLPPYIHRNHDEEEDKTRYQTVYAGADTHGSAAAPTAGLHFTPEILEQIKQRGVEIQHITLHVGLGTFQPVRAEYLADIRLHEEHYTLPAATAQALQRAQAEGRRIVAVGTTTTRTLEHCAGTNQLHEHSGSTSIFLSPGHRFRLVGALLTNFHLPQSTLLMLVSALAAPADNPDEGRQRILCAYAHAVEQRYRFFSYGDCMFLS